MLDVDAMLDALGQALIALSSGSTSVPPRVAARVPDLGLLGAMAGYVPGIALEAKLVSVFPGNHHHGLQSHQGLITLFDEKDGTPLAVMDGSYITAIRTGGTAAVAARALARGDAKVLAILGAGVQGSSHLEAFPRVRDFEDIRVASRDRAKALALAARHPRARAADSFEEAVRGTDVIACCTDAREPILAHELQGVDPHSLIEVGEVLSGAHPGRTSPDEITVYKSTGHAVEDAATARLVYDRARAEGVGVALPL